MGVLMIDHTYTANGVTYTDSNTGAKDDVTVNLVARANNTSPYLEVAGKTLTISEDFHSGHTLHVDGTVADRYSENTAEDVKETRYTDTDTSVAAFTGLSDEYQYSLTVAKHGYDATVTAEKQSNDNWVINVELKFNPSISDLEFEVKMADGVPTELYPAAAIVKVLYCDNPETDTWKVITQHDNGNPGVRVNIAQQTGNVGRYPVWVTDSGGAAYGYRVMVSAFVYKDGTIVPTNGTDNKSYTDKNYTASLSFSLMLAKLV